MINLISGCSDFKWEILKDPCAEISWKKPKILEICQLSAYFICVFDLKKIKLQHALVNLYAKIPVNFLTLIFHLCPVIFQDNYFCLHFSMQDPFNLSEFGNEDMEHFAEIVMKNL